MKKKSLEQQEKQYDERRKRLRRLLGLILFLTLTVIGMGLWASLRRRTTVVNVPVTLPKNVNRRLSGYTFTRSEEGRQIFTLHAARTLDYGKGAHMLLEDVHVIIFGRAGNRHDEVTTDRCQYDSETNALACSGKASVKLEAEAGMPVKPSLRDRQPLFLETSDISFDPSHSTITTPRAVHFHFGPASGASLGLVYNTRTGELILKRDVTLRLPQGGAGTIEALAGSLIYTKQSNGISLGAPIHVVQGGRELSASTGAVFLDAANRVTRVTLSGVQGSDVLPANEIKGSGDNLEADFDPGTNAVRALLATGHVVIEGREESKEGGRIRRLTAQKVSLSLAGAKSQPQSGNAQGNVELLFRPTGGIAVSSGSSRKSNPTIGAAGLAAGERILNAPELQFSFQSRSLLREAQTNGPSKLRLIPTDPTRDRQTVTAGKFQMAFDPAGRLENIHGFSSTRIVDQPPLNAKHSALPLVSTGDELLAKVDPATGAIETLQQKGNFKFQQGASRARAAEAQFEAQKQTLALSGRPELWDADGRIRADHILVGLADGVAEGRGNVQSIHFSLPPGSGSPAGATADSSPIIVLADRVTAYRERQYAHYEGNVRASHGPDVVQSSSLDVYRKQQQLSSGKGVVTSLVEPALSDAPESGGPSKHNKSEAGAVQPVTITADRLQYFNLGREAVYQGNVRMVSTDTTFTADRLQIYFSQPGGAKGAEIERAVADGHVRVTQAPGRRALGEHAEYFAAAGKVVLTGGPPVIYDVQQGYLTGQRLTFFTRDASLLAGGGNKSRTLSKRRILQQ
ncbi:MAG: LPS export ABC transporter periplasmic protein LptC [Terriglobia bacterium]